MSAETPNTVPALEVRRRLPAPPEVIFDIWTDPEQVKHWLGGPKMEVPQATIDLRVGGRYEYELSSPEGVRSRIFGTFLKIEQPQMLSFTWTIENDEGQSPRTTVEIEFVDRGDETEVVIVHDGFLDLRTRAFHEEGWEGCLEATIPLIA